MPFRVPTRSRPRARISRALALTLPRRGVAPRTVLLVWSIAAALVALASAAHGARSSCPLVTGVTPFANTTNTRYEIFLVDGMPGDLDGAADGGCDVSVRLCGGDATLCPAAEVVDDVRVRVSGGTSVDARNLVEERVSRALEQLSASDTPGACSVARLRLAAEEDASSSFRFRVAAHAEGQRTRTRRGRLTIHCLPHDDDGGAACRSNREECPGIAQPLCGNGVVDQSTEQCDGADATRCAEGACTETCTCSTPGGPSAPKPPGVPSCGQGTRDAVSGEACDGADDSACPGACRADCTCGTQSGAQNIAPLATPHASSAISGSSAIGAVDGVIGGPTRSSEWMSNGEGTGAWVRLVWPTPVTIEKVVLHDRSSEVDNVLDAAVVLDDGTPVPTGPLPPDGAPKAVMTGKKTVASLVFMVLQAAGTNAGLGEIEVVRSATQPPPPGPPEPPGPPQPPAPPQPPGPTGPAYHLSPSGDDANPGTSAGRPWRTFKKAIGALQPGDTLVLANGTYTKGTTGLPSITCGSGARDGTAAKPITIRAASPRRAHITSDGSQDAVYVDQCSHWTLDGLYATSADSTSAKPWAGNVLRITNSEHVRLRGVLAVRPNRTCPNGSLSYCNSHAIAIEKSRDMLVEDCEIYDFHRHGVSAFASRRVTVRRCYMNPWGATGGAGGGSTGVIFYGASDSTAENVIGEGVYGLNIAGGTADDGSPGGFRNKLLGAVTLNAKHGSTIRARKFGGPVLPAGDNTIRDSVFVRSDNVGIYARGASNSIVENVSIFGTKVDAGVAVDEDLGEGAPCSANPAGCSLTARNLLSVGNRGQGMRVKTSVVRRWSLEHSVMSGNQGGDFPSGETTTDDAGSIRRSRAVAPTGMGTGAGQCILWVPDGSNMKGAGSNGRDVGANVLYRYRDGVLTTEPLWDRATGAFPCGPTVAGVNDQPARSCIGVHQRLNVNTNGCRFPSNY
jgi:hypothetical protein